MATIQMLFREGPLDGRAASIQMPGKVQGSLAGRVITIRDNLYEIMSGPAVAYFDMEGKGHPNLCAIAVHSPSQNGRIHD